MSYIKHIVAVLLALLMCGPVSAQKVDVLSNPISADSIEHIGASAFIADKQQYLDSLSAVFSGRNLHIYSEGLLRSTTAYTASDTIGASMRAVYVVKRPFNVTSSVVLPWYGQPGMGTQIKTPIPINDLVKQGFLKKIK